QVERPVLGPKKTAGGERLQLLLLAVPFEPLADVDERWQDRVIRSADAGDPGADVWARHGLWGDVAGVPVVLMPAVEDVPQVGGDVRPDQGGPVHHLGDVLEPLGELDVVHNAVDGREG